MKKAHNRESIDNQKLKIAEDLKEAFNDVKLHEAGIKKLRTAKELLKDLDIKNNQSKPWRKKSST
jgi:hypothetical protein